MNIKFKKLAVPRIVGLNTNLIGHPLPERKEADSATVGRYCDTLCKAILGETGTQTSGVDITHLKLEVKSKDIHSTSDWTIGTMTVEDIVSTNYIDTSLYQKLQALWLIRYDNDLRIICKSDICYFDYDEIQERIQEGYESCRKEVIAFYNAHQNRIKQDQENTLFLFDTASKKIVFDKSHQFKGIPGYRLEYNNSGKNIKFRITTTEMNSLEKMSNSLGSKLFEFN